MTAVADWPMWEGLTLYRALLDAHGAE